MKDHEIAQLVNALRDCAVNYCTAQQLREQIAALIVPVLRGERSPESTVTLALANHQLRKELRSVLIAVDSVFEYDTPGRIATLMREIGPLMKRHDVGQSGWGSGTAAKGFGAGFDPSADALQQSSSGITAGAEKPSQVVDFGAAGPNRTGDLLITNQNKDTPETSHNQDVTPKTAPAQPAQTAPTESSGCEGVTAGSEPVHPSLRHVYEDEGTSNCAHGCGCWMGPFRSGGPDGIDPSPFARCPNAVPASDGELVDVYQLWVDQAWNGRRADDGNALRHLFIMSVGLGGEAGEVQELLKKHVRDGVLDKRKLLLELGDVAYYLTRIASWFGMSLRQVLEANQAKITERQARGKFVARS